MADDPSTGIPGKRPRSPTSPAIAPTAVKKRKRHAGAVGEGDTPTAPFELPAQTTEHVLKFQKIQLLKRLKERKCELNAVKKQHDTLRVSSLDIFATNS